MDIAKCRRLKAEWAGQAEPLLVPIEQFFDGNDDLGSIGCNLMEHPGIDAFRRVLVRLQQLPGVKAVYARISELDPDEEMWPFSDAVVVVGDISPDALREAVDSLTPDDILSSEEFDIPPSSLLPHGPRAWVVWWD